MNDGPVLTLHGARGGVDCALESPGRAPARCPLQEGRVRVWAAALWVGSFLAAAVAVAVELQVPLDHAGRVQRIDAALARRLQMFADRPDFQDARLFQLADSSYVLEITSLAGPGLSRERIPLTALGADSLRSVVTIAMVEN